MKVKLLVCGRCRATWYCGAAHQKLDFAHHREICRTIHALRQQSLASPVRTPPPPPSDDACHDCALQSVAEVRRLLGDAAPDGSEEALRFTLHKRVELQMAQRMLRRELQRNESELIMFQVSSLFVATISPPYMLTCMCVCVCV